MIKLRNSLFLSILTTLFSINVFAANLPTITFDKDEEANVDKKLGKSTSFYYHPTWSYLQRRLGFNQNKIISFYNYDWFKERLNKQENYNIGNYNFLTFSNTPVNFSDGTYIFSGNNNTSKAIGYYLIEDFEIRGYEDEPAIKGITSMPVDNSYFTTPANFPNDVTLTFYTKENNGFKEVYCIMKTKGPIMLLLDAFYPTELEPALKQRLTNVINAYIIRGRR